MKIEFKGFVFLIIIGIFLNVDANSFCYRADFTTNVPVTGTVASRSSEIQIFVGNIIEEFRNDSTLGYTVGSYNSTLEQLLGNTSYTEYVVSICLTDSSKTASEFTIMLQTFNITTQIGSATVSGNDFNECTNTSLCTSPATCSNTDGSYNCACPDTLADKSTSGSSEPRCELPTNHTCTTNSIDLAAYYPYFSALGINETDLTLGSCSGSLSGDTINFSGQCSPEIQANSTHIIYKWNLTSINPNATVTIGTYVLIPIQCVYDTAGNASLLFNTSIADDNIEFKNLFFGASQSLDIEVNAFSGKNIVSGTPVTPGDTIKTNEDLTFEMGPTNGFISENIKTVCQGLSSSPADATSGPVVLIENGCKVNNARYGILSNTLSIGNSGTSPKASITIGAHFYRGSSATTMSFEVSICIATAGSSCEPTCNSRRRRSFIQVRQKRSTLEYGFAFFTFVKDRDDECKRDCGDGICIIDVSKRQECACLADASKQSDGRCLSEGSDQSLSTENNKTEIIIILLVSVISVLVVLLIISIVVYFICIKRKRNGDKYIE